MSEKRKPAKEEYSWRIWDKTKQEYVMAWQVGNPYAGNGKSWTKKKVPAKVIEQSDNKDNFELHRFKQVFDAIEQ